jgi:GTPase
MSNKTGEGLDLFVNFLNILPENVKEDPILFDSNEKFDILEIINLKEKDKTILCGIVSHGSIYVGMQYYLGPDSKGNFKHVTVENIHCKKIIVKSAIQGQYCSLQLDNSINKDNVRKGMVLLNYQKEPTACFSFEAEIWNIENTESKVKYTLQPSVNISHIRQVVKIRKPEEATEDELTIMPGQIMKINFEFMYYPEYVVEGSHIIILENSFKVYGYVTKVNI